MRILTTSAASALCADDAIKVNGQTVRVVRKVEVPSNPYMGLVVADLSGCLLAPVTVRRTDRFPVYSL